MRRILSSVFLIFLAGCSSAPVKTYLGPELDQERVALIRASSGDDFDAFSLGFIKYYAELDNGSVDLRTFTKGIGMYPSQIIVLPGEYEIDITCNFMEGGARTTLKQRILPGSIYEINCSWEGNTLFGRDISWSAWMSDPIPYQ